MKIKNTSDLDAHFLKALIFGPSGSGKTTLAKTLSSYKTLIISAEGGLLSLQGADIDMIDIARDDKDELIEDKKTRLTRLADIYKYLLTDKKYQCVFIDSLSEISQTMVEALQKEFPDRKDSLVLWGENVKRMRALIKCFRDLPDKHVFVTCLSEVEKDDIGKRFTTVDLAGKISKEVAAFFDLVMYLSVADGKRTLITQPTEKMVCKDRSGRLLPEEDADLSLIIKKALLPKEKK